MIHGAWLMLEKSRHFLGRLLKDLKIKRDDCSRTRQVNWKTERRYE